eukprot:maker-scaffold326_size205590-snap-gene-0.16 protein:Tk02473 transcript:maker-scaffold326_size205590-snap-gene-0.16-mRNA-1 annotation:"hypothetical protein D910_04166"
MSNLTLPSRQKRVFSLFNVVQFKNDRCQTQSSADTTGTCLSASECSTDGGQQDGNCASGFGVCCLFSITGCNGAVERTFVKSGECGNTGDTLNVLSPHSSSPFAFPPTVCGTLSGQHMYFESGRTGNAGTVNIVQGTATGDRRFNIKVTYIHCNSRSRAPSGCTQFFTGVTGTISSYNFGGGQVLENQHYGNCIRQEKGYCQVQYAESAITTPDPFQLSTGGSVKDDCQQKNHVTIPSTTNEVLSITLPRAEEISRVPSMRCGQVFGSQPGTDVPGALTSQENTPFVVNVRTIPGDNNALDTFTGFSLDYTQVPC